jgi:hypothetical protein
MRRRHRSASGPGDFRYERAWPWRWSSTSPFSREKAPDLSPKSPETETPFVSGGLSANEPLSG